MLVKFSATVSHANEFITSEARCYLRGRLKCRGVEPFGLGEVRDLTETLKAEIRVVRPKRFVFTSRDEPFRQRT